MFHASAQPLSQDHTGGLISRKAPVHTPCTEQLKVTWAERVFAKWTPAVAKVRRDLASCG